MPGITLVHEDINGTRTILAEFLLPLAIQSGPQPIIISTARARPPRRHWHNRPIKVLAVDQKEYSKFLEYPSPADSPEAADAVKGGVSRACPDCNWPEEHNAKPVQAGTVFPSLRATGEHLGLQPNELSVKFFGERRRLRELASEAGKPAAPIRPVITVRGVTLCYADDAPLVARDTVQTPHALRPRQRKPDGQTGWGGTRVPEKSAPFPILFPPSLTIE